jgi:hypothetical protein
MDPRPAALFSTRTPQSFDYKPSSIGINAPGYRTPAEEDPNWAIKKIAAKNEADRQAQLQLQAAAQKRMQQEAAAAQAEYDRIAEQVRTEQARIQENLGLAEVARAEEAKRQAEVQQQFERDRGAQQQMIAMQRLATQAAARSMSVLPKATSTPPRAAFSAPGRAWGRTRSVAGSQSLRIGSQGRSPGVGLNIGG